ncbi:hypothetical protein BABINDRAFT_173096 [Babjeviella inositovora NRRL Y-12698]|uniref:Cytochrome b n=1 Tax=Babjeviella inositovora NRRL Y-12698 TaxID=984486 RepID=A0A1E3QH18_9ASCO|nr:uncharacterized protein BABINDRAFT_173096 [Babjeviella inositovora NRRL Y-12698]ODQ76908.1 hypothetical protein BABINDRAFT_173096 [Babjeviella inositovora NRRL Y-12698]
MALRKSQVYLQLVNRSLLGLCLVIQIATGVFLAMHYSSHIELAFDSVEHIMPIRYMHANGASFFFVCMYIHIGKALYYGSYRTPRGFSVSNPTIQRFFALHFLLPFILAALVIMHLIALHVNGSSNPLGITGNIDRLPMHPYFIFKDAVTGLVFLLVFTLFVFYSPNSLGHPDNYIEVIAMFAALLILLVLPYTDRSIVRGFAFKPLSKLLFFAFVFNFVLLANLGQLHIEVPFIALGINSTIFYFSYFIILTPLVSTIENLLFYMGRNTA